MEHYHYIYTRGIKTCFNQILIILFHGILFYYNKTDGVNGEENKTNAKTNVYGQSEVYGTYIFGTGN